MVYRFKTTLSATLPYTGAERLDTPIDKHPYFAFSPHSCQPFSWSITSLKERKLYCSVSGRTQILRQLYKWNYMLLKDGGQCCKTFK